MKVILQINDRGVDDGNAIIHRWTARVCRELLHGDNSLTERRYVAISIRVIR